MMEWHALPLIIVVMLACLRNGRAWEACQAGGVNEQQMEHGEALLQLHSNRKLGLARSTPNETKQTPYVVYSIGAAENLEDKLEACLSTWASTLRQDQLQIIGTAPKTPEQAPLARWNEAPNCSDDHSGGACKDAVGLADAYETGADWVMLVGADNYVIPENVETVLSSYDANRPIVLGIKGCGECAAGGLCGGGGQIFSRGTLSAFLAHGRASFLEKHSSMARVSYYGDVTNCRLASVNNVPVESLLGLTGWQEDIKQMTEELHSENPLPLTWHYVDREKMFAVDHLRKHPEAALIQFPKSSTSRADAIAKYSEDLAKYVKDENARRAKAVTAKKMGK